MFITVTSGGSSCLDLDFYIQYRIMKQLIELYLRNCLKCSSCGTQNKFTGPSTVQKQEEERLGVSLPLVIVQKATV